MHISKNKYGIKVIHFELLENNVFITLLLSFRSLVYTKFINNEHIIIGQRNCVHIGHKRVLDILRVANSENSDDEPFIPYFSALKASITLAYNYRYIICIVQFQIAGRWWVN